MIGSCCLEDVAVRVLTRVIGHCPHRNQLLIDCGWAGIRWVQLHSMVANTYPLSSVFVLLITAIINVSSVLEQPCNLTFHLLLLVSLSLDGAGKLPTGYAVIEGLPNLK